MSNPRLHIYLDQAWNLILEIPSPTAEVRASSVTIPQTEKGMEALTRILREQTLAANDADLYVGRDANPVLSQLEGWIRSSWQGASRDRKTYKVLSQHNGVVVRQKLTAAKAPKAARLGNGTTKSASELGF